MSRAWLSCVAAVTLVLGAAPSAAETEPEQGSSRTVSVAYAVGSGIDCERTLGCVTLVPKKGEKHVHFTVRDASGMRVYGTVTEYLRPTPQVFGVGTEFCGEGSYATPDGQPVYVYFENHLGSWHHCAGAATQGYVEATFFGR